MISRNPISRRPISRRAVLRTGAGIAAAATVGAPAILHAQTKTLKITTWGGKWGEIMKGKVLPAFEKEFNRLPSVFAAQGWDTAMLIDAGVRDSKGKLEDVEAVRKALRAAKFESVRGAFKFNRNQMPIQNYYLRVVAKDSKGRLVNKTIGTIFKDHGDAYVQECPMK